MFLVVAALGACAVFGPADRNAITQTAATLETCQEVGRACKADGGANCWDKYDACVTDAGLR